MKENLQDNNTVQQKTTLYPALISQSSPLQNAHPLLKDYFASLTPQSITDQTLPNLPLPPQLQEAHLSPKDMCTKLIKTGQKYYYCHDCARNKGAYQMIYCQACFQQTRHQGHVYQQKKAAKADQVSCDCGRELLLNKNSFCTQHRCQPQNKTIQLKEEDEKIFNQYFGKLLDILIFLKDQPEHKYQLLQKAISITLCSLCQQSLYYTTLTSRMLHNKSTVNAHKTYQQHLQSFHEFIPLCLQLAGSKDYLLKFGDFMLWLEEKCSVHQYYFRDLRFQLINSPEYLKQRAKLGHYYPDIIGHYFYLLENQQFQFQQPIDQKDNNQNQTDKKSNRISKFLFKIYQNLDPEQFIDILFTIFKDGSKQLLKDETFHSQALVKILEIYKDPALDKKEKSKQQNKNKGNTDKAQESIQTKQDKKQQEKVQLKNQGQQSKNTQIKIKQKQKQQGKKDQKQAQKQVQIKTLSKDQKLKLRKCLSIIGNIMVTKSDNKIQNLKKTTMEQFYPTTSEQNKQSPQQSKNKHSHLTRNLQYMLDLLFHNELFLSFKKYQLSQIMIFVIILLDLHPRKQILLAKLWGEVIQITNNNFFDNLEKIYDLVGFLGNLYRKYIFFATDQSEQTMAMNQTKIKQNIFKSYLRENKQIPNKKLWQNYSKKNGWLNFPSCPNILNQLCKFNNNNDTFSLKPQLAKNIQSQANILLRLPQQTNRNAQNVRNMNISYDSPNICRSKTLKSLLLTLFKTDQFYNAFICSFIKGLQSVEKEARSLERWKQRGVGEFYCILLLIIHKMCGGEENELIIQQIEKIRLNIDQYRFRFTQIGSQQRIKKVLQIDQPIPQQTNQSQQIPKVEQQLQQSQQDIKKKQILEKSKQRKQQIRQRMRKKRGNMLQKIKKESSVVEQQQQNFCLSCKQRQKKDNYFVVLTKISRQNLMSKTLHTAESKSQNKICTNMHIVHIECYKKIKKKQMQFPCPLCKEDVNCFLPYKANKASKEELDICWNVMNAALVCSCQVYETGSLFAVLLDSLVESLGFKQLVMAKKSSGLVSFKRKVDNYLIQTLSCIHSLCSQAQKAQHHKIYKKYKENLETCKQKQTKYFQMVILQALFFRVTGEEEVDATIMDSLYKLMVEDQWKILIKTIQFITEGNSQVLSSYGGLSLQKISEQQIGENMEKSQEKIVSLQKLQQSDTQQQSINTQSPVVSTQQQLQQTPNRKILGIHILYPPSKLDDFLSPKFLKSINCLKCANCQSNDMKILCLICRKAFCQNCSQNQIHTDLHIGKYISIDLQTTRIYVETKDNTEKHDLYFNPFMIEYKGQDNKQNDNESESDQIELSTVLNNAQGGAINNLDKIPNKSNKQLEYKFCESRFGEIVEAFYNLGN